MAVTIPAVSKEYLKGAVTASVALDTQAVEVAFLPTSQAAPDGATSWIAAAWDGVAGTTRSWRLLIGPGTAAALSPGQHAVWVRVTDVTEQPVRKHDTVTIT